MSLLVARIAPDAYLRSPAKKQQESARITHHCVHIDRHRRAIDLIISRTRSPPMHFAPPQRA
ncbi:hypothetical protein [Burkholderia ambifaria]|uniref:hypothetical protein n=1 Tax=Burkholderia ambifaria TaxID=152480 RepID=UPI00315CE404